MSFLNDLRYAVRSLRARKAFAAACVLTLALGIGANTAVFTVVNAVLLRTLPVDKPDELVMFYWLRQPDPMVESYSGYGRQGPNGAGVRTSFSSLTFERFRDQSSTLAQVFAIAPLRDASVSADGQTDGVTADLVSGGYFEGLGVPAARGRVLTDADDRIEAEAVAVISHRYWQRRFDGDPAVVGRAIHVNRVPVTIVGVTPEGFDGIRMTETTDITMPMALAARVEGGTTRAGVDVVDADHGSAEARREATSRRWPTWSASSTTALRESWAARPSSSSKPGTSMPRLGIMSGSQGTEAPRRDALPVLGRHRRRDDRGALDRVCQRREPRARADDRPPAGDRASCLVGREPRPGPEARAGRERRPRARGRSARDRVRVLGPELPRLAAGHIYCDCRCASRLASDRIRRERRRPNRDPLRSGTGPARDTYGHHPVHESCGVAASRCRPPFNGRRPGGAVAGHARGRRGVSPDAVQLCARGCRVSARTTC